MSNILFIIGNGFDLAHRLPTRFDPDFREIAEKNESNPYFWELYQSAEPNIWSDFENLLAKPDFNSLAEIFEYYAPDHSSDRESDRDGIILEAEMSGNLKESLEEFANQEENLQILHLRDSLKTYSLMEIYISISIILIHLSKFMVLK